MFVAVVRRPGDDDALRLPELLGVLRSDFLQEEGAELYRRHRLRADGPGLVGAHFALELGEDVRSSGAKEFLGFGADDDVAGLVDLDHRRGDVRAFAVVGDLGFAGFVETGDEGGGGTEVDTDDIGGFVGHGRQLAGVEGVASGGGEGWIYR